MDSMGLPSRGTVRGCPAGMRTEAHEKGLLLWLGSLRRPVLPSRLLSCLLALPPHHGRCCRLSRGQAARRPKPSQPAVGECRLLACLHERGLNPHDAVADGVGRSGLADIPLTQGAEYILSCSLQPQSRGCLGSVDAVEVAGRGASSGRCLACWDLGSDTLSLRCGCGRAPGGCLRDHRGAGGHGGPLELLLGVRRALRMLAPPTWVHSCSGTEQGRGSLCPSVPCPPGAGCQGEANARSCRACGLTVSLPGWPRTWGAQPRPPSGQLLATCALGSAVGTSW